jgi:hypothetical protein
MWYMLGHMKVNVHSLKTCAFNFFKITPSNFLYKKIKNKTNIKSKFLLILKIKKNNIFVLLTCALKTNIKRFSLNS